ncbi:MAG: methyl-coenzyme M reductase operon protein D [Candidatus Bathyarchaeota archaeon]
MIGGDVCLEVEVFPLRLISQKNAEKVAKKLWSIKGVTNVLFDALQYEDGEDGPVKRLIIQVDDPSIVDKIDKVLKKLLPIGYHIRVGRFTKPRPTVSDYLKGRIATDNKVEKT